MKKQYPMIRSLHKEDIDRVAAIWLESNIKTHDFIPQAYWERHFIPVKEQLTQAELYVYEDEKNIQGFIGLEGDYIAGIFVSENSRSRGIGKALMDHVKAKNTKLRLNVYQKNGRALRFYQREGFRIWRERYDEAVGEKEYEMRWETLMPARAQNDRP